VQQDERRREWDERHVHVGAAFIPDTKSTKAIEPLDGELDDPAVSPRARRRLNADARDPTGDAMRVQKAPAVRFVVAFVRVHLARPAAWMPALAERAMEEWDRIEHVLEHDRVVHLRGREERGERKTAGIDHKMALRARLCAIRWIRPGRFAPFLPGCSSNPRPRGSSQLRRHRSSAATARARAGPRRRPLASRAGAASKSFHTRSPSPAARRAKDTPSAGQ
jgi:hypothetical protein